MSKKSVSKLFKSIKNLDVFATRRQVVQKWLINILNLKTKSGSPSVWMLTHIENNHLKSIQCMIILTLRNNFKESHLELIKSGRTKDCCLSVHSDAFYVHSIKATYRRNSSLSLRKATKTTTGCARHEVFYQPHWMKIRSRDPVNSRQTTELTTELYTQEGSFLPLVLNKKAFLKMEGV